MKFNYLLQIIFLVSIITSQINCTNGGLKPVTKKGDDEDAEISDKELDEMLKKPEYAKLLESIPSKSEVEGKLKKTGGKEGSNDDLINMAASETTLPTMGAIDAKSPSTKSVKDISNLKQTELEKIQPKVPSHPKPGKVQSYKETQAYKDHLARIRAKHQNHGSSNASSR